MKLPQQVSQSVKRRNPELYPVGKTLCEVFAKEKPDGLTLEGPNHTLAACDFAEKLVRNEARAKRVRQSTKPLMNKLEAEWHQILLRELPGSNIRIQSRNYKLANGVWFRPDFTCVLREGETAWEVKGPHAWEDSIVKLKVAAHEWPEVKWILVWKEDSRCEFRQQVILP